MIYPPLKRGAFRRRVLALIATGSTLGLGATVVLANWTDVEKAFAEFGTSTFAIEGAAQNADDTWEPYANHNPTAGTLEAKLDFGDAATRVQPGTIVSARYRVRLTPDTNEPGEMTIVPNVLGEGTPPPLAEFIDTATLIGDPTSNSCEEHAVHFDLFGDGANGDVLRVAPGDDVIFCILVRFNETNAQGEPLPQGSAAGLNRISWVITAESGFKPFAIDGASRYPRAAPWI